MNHQHNTTAPADCCSTRPVRGESAHSAVDSTPYRTGGLSVGGSVVAAVLSSACCWLPLLLLAFGASAAGVSAFFERWRPVFLVVAVALLGGGFYVVYFRKESCTGGACEAAPPSRRTVSKVMLWLAAALVTAFALFPRYAGTVASALYGLRAGPGTVSAATTATVHRFAVEGMSCEACATTLEADLSKIEGVGSAHVDYASKSAEVRGDAPELDARVAAAAEKHGYRATPR